MTAQEISNDQIRRFFIQNIQGKKGVYFLISTGELGDNKLYPLHELSDEYKGEKKFFEMLENAFDEDPYNVGISVYKKINGRFPKNPIDFKKIVLKKEKTEQTLGNIEALDTFGGFQGVLEAQINSRYLSDNNQNLKKQIEKLERENEELKKSAKKHKEKNTDLKDEIKNKEWTIRTLEEDHKRKLDHISIDRKRELDGIEQKSDRFEKILTVSGLVVAKAAGLEEGDLRGILGIDEETKSIENTAKEPIDTSDIDIEEVNTYTGKKAEAKAMIDAINVFFLETLRNNNETEAFNIIATFSNIINYAKADFNNLKMLHELVMKASQNHNKQSSADAILEQVKNYNK